MCVGFVICVFVWCVCGFCNVCVCLYVYVWCVCSVCVRFIMSVCVGFVICVFVFVVCVSVL